MKVGERRECWFSRAVGRFAWHEPRLLLNYRFAKNRQKYWPVGRGMNGGGDRGIGRFNPAEGNFSQQRERRSVGRLAGSVGNSGKFRRVGVEVVGRTYRAFTNSGKCSGRS